MSEGRVKEGKGGDGGVGALDMGWKPSGFTGSCCVSEGKVRFRSQIGAESDLNLRQSEQTDRIRLFLLLDCTMKTLLLPLLPPT